jgi:hypothetical protein
MRSSEIEFSKRLVPRTCARFISDLKFGSEHQIEQGKCAFFNGARNRTAIAQISNPSTLVDEWARLPASDGAECRVD